jgi:hypothetical protein
MARAERARFRRVLPVLLEWTPDLPAVFFAVLPVLVAAVDRFDAEAVLPVLWDVLVESDDWAATTAIRNNALSAQAGRRSDSSPNDDLNNFIDPM